MNLEIWNKSLAWAESKCERFAEASRDPSKPLNEYDIELYKKLSEINAFNTFGHIPKCIVWILAYSQYPSFEKAAEDLNKPKSSTKLSKWEKVVGKGRGK